MSSDAPAAPRQGAEPAPGVVKDRPGRRRLRQRLAPYVFLLVPLTLLIVLTYIPVVNMFYYSLTDWDGLDKTKNLVGLDNYLAVFTDPDNLRVFFVSLYYFAGSFVQMGLALYFATILSFNVRFKNMWKGVLFFPYLINGVAIGLIFLNFVQPGGGLDATLTALGLEEFIRQWTGDPDVINFTLATVSVWRYMGLNLVMFLGAIASIPGEIYEAAAIDGANRWNQFRHIILPSIRSILGLSFILAISGALSVFEIPYVMTNGGNGSETFVIRTVKMAFENGKVGLASAMAVILLVVVLLVTWLQRTLVPEEEVNLT
ncbi:MAG: carbohydrate ABC transporter permease [Arachnia sp.]